MAKTDKAPSVLAFERKLNPSDACMYAGQWSDIGTNQWQPIAIREKSVRGTISNRLKSTEIDASKINAKIENPNPQRIDAAALPDTSDTLKVVFTLRMIGNVGVPSACNDRGFSDKLALIVQGYRDASGFKELAKRYALTLANGRFLWRNRVGAEQIQVVIDHLGPQGIKESWTFDGLSFNFRSFDDGASEHKVQPIADIIAKALAGGDDHALLRITAYVQLGAGQEVYPSQEMLLDSNEKKSKTLYALDGIAAIHSQKIGNALRTIDTWHPEVGTIGPIAVEPYGAVTSLGIACRQPKSGNVDFYSLLDKWILQDTVPPIEQQHFTLAVLIRGGVFSQSGKE